MEGQRVDVVPEAHPPRPLHRRRDHQIRTRQQRVIREVMLREPALPKPQPLRQLDLIEHLGVGLIVRHTPPLAVIEEPEVHSRESTGNYRDA